MDGDGFAAGGLDAGNDLLGCVFAAGIVDGDGSAVGREFTGDGRANALGCAGDQRDFAF